MVWNVFEGRLRKRLCEQRPGGCGIDAACAQIEQRVLVELAETRAMRALHIVGVDHQIGLGVDLGAVRQQQVR